MSPTVSLVGFTKCGRDPVQGWANVACLVYVLHVLSISFTQADPLLILPIVCLSSTYANLELGFANLRESQTILRFFKDNFQLLLILGAPITATLPSGVFVYWLTSSLFGHAQHFAFKNAAIRKALGFPALPSSLQQGKMAKTAAASSSSTARGSTGLILPPSMMQQAIDALDDYEKRKLSKKS